MPKGLIGKKLGMTQIFEGEEAIPVTVIEAGPCLVTQVRTQEKDGYTAVQLGFEEAKPAKLNRPLKGHFEKKNLKPVKKLLEIRVGEEEVSGYQVGSELKVDIFKPGEKVDIVGISKGKGFTGVVKRHGFRGFPASHGSRYHRAGGSIGMAAFPARVIKGMKMAGRQGGTRVTVQNLKVVKVVPEDNLLLVRGAVPGPVGGYVLIKEAVKRLAGGKS